MKNALILGILFFFLAGCLSAGQSTNSISSSGKKALKVGVSTNAPPMIYKEGSEIVGLEADFAEGLARSMGRKLQFVQVKWGDQIPSLLSGKTDIIMSGMTITEARGYRIVFCAPYLLSGQIPLVRRTDKYKYTYGLTDLFNPALKIGTITGTTGDKLIQETRAKGQRIQFAKSAQAAKALINNELDALVYDLPGNMHLSAIYADQGLTAVNVLMSREEIAWGVRPGDTEMLNAANAYLQLLNQNKKRLQMIQRWIPAYRR